MASALDQLLDAGRPRIEVPDPVLAEARRRRGQIETALRSAFPGCTVYYNGSVAHGDAIDPLSDIDLGALLPPSLAAEYGPEGDSPLALMEAARDAIREHLADEYDNLVVTVAGQRRAVLVRFGDPVTPGQDDFTCDVIVALPHPEQGLWIPNTEIDAGWDQADPIEHTRLVLKAIAETEVVFARAVRLLKHWRDRHGDPICSWNIKALALDSITEPMGLTAALLAFFDQAARDLAERYTSDPAGVAGSVRPTFERKHAVSRLRLARDRVQEAIEDQRSNRPASAQHKLHWLLPDVVEEPDWATLNRETAGSVTAATSATVTRAWAP